MNRPEKATRSHGKPSDDDDETTGLGLPVSLKRQIESYAVMHHMTPTQVLAEGMKLLLTTPYKHGPYSVFYVVRTYLKYVTTR